MAAEAAVKSYDIPKPYKVAVYDKPGSISIRIEDLPTPEPGPGEVLVRLIHSGVCHSDLSIMQCRWTTLPFPTPKGQIGGHEGVGIVQKLGQGAEMGIVTVGDRVGIKWAASAYFTPGTFAQYAIGPANYVTLIPKKLASADAAPLLCAGLTSYSALRKCREKSGQWVVVSGAGGGLGHLAIQIGAQGMAFRMIGIDHGSKESLVMDCGAEAFVDMTKFDDTSIAEEIKRITDGVGVAAVIVCAGSNRAYAQALPMLHFGGTMVCVGLPEGNLQLIGNAYPNTICVNQASIVDSTVGSQCEALEVLALAARGLVKTHYRLEKLDKLGEVFKEMSANAMQGRGVLD